MQKLTFKFDQVGANPIDQTEFFIWQHYSDFLGRNPDSTGFQGWQHILNGCGTTVAQPCDRIEVSSDFVRSEEFQNSRYFIYLYYAILGQIPHYNQFGSDLDKLNPYLTGKPLEDNKAAYANDFITRADYLDKYGSIPTPTGFVDAVLQTVGLPNHPSRNAWIAGLTNDTMSRATILRALVDSAELRQKYYNEAFVIMEYFGYLHRDADALYLKWLDLLNKTGDYRTMVNGFLNSAEYRQRFGS